MSTHVQWEEVLELVKAADKSGDTIKGQQVLFMLGFTGAGKTTTLLYLEGKELVQGPNESIVLKNPEEEEKWKISKNNSKSETRYISAKKLKDIVAVDAAGLEDTEGPSVEIANLYSVTSTLQLCASVIPVLVINYFVLKSDRGQYLRKLFTYIGKLFNNKKEVLYDSLMVLITKAPPRGAVVEEFGDKLKEMLESDSTGNSPEFHTVADAILDLIEDGVAAVSVVNPLKTREKKALMDKILQRAPIENPAKICKFSMTRELEVEIERALSKIQLDIPNWVENGEMRQLMLHLELFQTLHQKLEFLRSPFENMVNSVQQLAKKRQDESITRFNEFICNPTSRNTTDIKNLNEMMTLLEQLEQVRSFLTKEILTKEAFQNFVQKGIETLRNDIKHEDRDFVKLNNIFQQIKFCEELVPFIKELNLSANARQEIGKKIEKLHQNIISTNFNDYSSTTLPTLATNISALKSAYVQVHEIIDDSFPSISDCKVKLSELLNKWVWETEKVGLVKT